MGRVCAAKVGFAVIAGCMWPVAATDPIGPLKTFGTGRSAFHNAGPEVALFEYNLTTAGQVRRF